MILVELLVERREHALAHLLSGLSLIDRITKLGEILLEVVQCFDDKGGAALVSSIIKACDELNTDEALLVASEKFAGDAKALAQCASDYNRDQLKIKMRLKERLEDYRKTYRVGILLGLFGRLPAEVRGDRFQESRLLLETKRALIAEVLGCWATTDSDELGQSIWEHLLVMPLCPSEVKFEYEKFLSEVLRRATDDRITISRLDRSLLSLRSGFNGISPASMFHDVCREERILSLARTRKLSSVEMRQEIAILQPLRNCSFEAYEATAEESKRIALQDVSAQKLLALLKGNDHLFSGEERIYGGISLQYPDRSTVVAKILCDANRDFRNQIPDDATLHRWVELAKTVASTWHEDCKTRGDSHMRVIIRLLTCAKTYSAPKEVKLFREEIVR